MAKIVADKYFAKFLKNISSELKEIKPSVVLEETNITEETTAERVANYLSSSQKLDNSIPTKNDDLLQSSTNSDIIPAAPENIEKQRWNDPLLPLDKKFVTFKDMNDHYNLFLNRIQQQMSNMSGGGEVNLRNLDDVDRSTIGPNRHLAYNPTTKKFFFEEVAIVEISDDNYTTSIGNNTISVINLPANTAIGPIEQLSFNTSHNHQEVRVEGTLCWDPDDRTLNLTHPDDVVQQIGQELYGKVGNNTGSTITNGTAVRFAGASMNGTAKLEVAPFEADGAFPSLYAFGIATQDIANGADGLVTVWGKVRDIDTTGAGENWQVGDILYVSPTTAGALTNIKPTAPNNVVPMAAVLRVDATEGEIFVRPTIEQKMSYGKFERTTDLSVAATNTAYVIDFDTTEIANGVTRVVGNTTRLQVDQSGLYQIDISAQVDASGGGFSSGTMFMWVRKNGVDVADSTRRQGVLGSAPSANIGFVVVISLAANDYVEIGYAGDSTSLRFDAAAATAFAPSTAAVKVGVTQIQL